MRFISIGWWIDSRIYVYEFHGGKDDWTLMRGEVFFIFNQKVYFWLMNRHDYNGSAIPIVAVIAFKQVDSIFNFNHKKLRIKRVKDPPFYKFQPTNSQFNSKSFPTNSKTTKEFLYCYAITINVRNTFPFVRSIHIWSIPHTSLTISLNLKRSFLLPFHLLLNRNILNFM